jgi:hypothetical protein
MNSQKLEHVRQLPPSPLNGERAGVRGEAALARPMSQSASAASPVFPAASCPDATHAPAGPPKSSPESSARPSVENSKSASSECCATSNTHRELYPSLAAREGHAGGHRVPNCSGLRHNKSPDGVRRPCVAAGTYRQKTCGHAESPTASFLPTSPFCEAHGQFGWKSSRADLAEQVLRFKGRFAISPLTLTLSPLRGEGPAIGRIATHWTVFGFVLPQSYDGPFVRRPCALGTLAHCPPGPPSPWKSEPTW